MNWIVTSAPWRQALRASGARPGTSFDSRDGGSSSRKVLPSKPRFTTPCWAVKPLRRSSRSPRESN